MRVTYALQPEEGEGKGERDKKGRGAYRDEGPLTKMLNTPLTCSTFLCQFSAWLAN